jgi:competence protein ComEC
MRTHAPVRVAAVAAVLAVSAACGTTPGSPTPDAPAPAPDTSGAPAPDDADDATTAPQGELAVHFLDVGQGDATLLLHDDATMLVDTGRHTTTDVIDHLDRLDVDRLDVVALTHPHADHIGQTPQVLDRYDVAEVWASGAVHDTLTFERALEAIETSAVAYEEPRAGDTTTVGPFAVDIVGPDDDADFGDLHDSGLSFRVTYGGVAFLFTGDAETHTEARYADRHPELLAADIYQAGHHGSRTSSTQPLLDAAAPSVAVYSAGAGNSYGHPHGSVLDRLAANDIDVYGTDVHGTVTVTTDGVTYDVTTDTDGTPAGAPDDDPHEHGADGSCVDLNTASADELTAIVHVGPSRADDIVANRPYGSVDDLTAVDGLGDARVADIADEGLACV